MRWFNDLKTATKLGLSFCAIVVTLLVALVTGYRTISTIRDSQRRLLERDASGAIALMQERSNLNAERANVLQLVFANTRTTMDSLTREIATRAAREDSTLAMVADLFDDNPEFGRQLAAMKGDLMTYRQVRQELIRLAASGKVDEARRLTMGSQAERYAAMRQTLVLLGDSAIAAAQRKLADADLRASQTLRWFALIGVFALIVGVAAAWLLNAIIARPLLEVAGVAERMAAGDLSSRVSADRRRDEVGMLVRSFATLTTSLREQLGDLSEGANVLGSSASEIVAATTQLAATAAESATAVSETTTTVEEVRQTAELASQKSGVLARVAQQATESATSGRKSTDDVAAGMARIRQQMDAIALSMTRLTEQGQAIGQIVATVEDLATQSNMLAVNAAIKAAEAGEHGRGFGVVALEVRSLAEQSRQATGQVRTLLGDIQKATSAAVLASEQGSKAVDAGSEQTELAADAIKALEASVQEAAQAATQIAASSKQQLVGVDQVLTAMQSLNEAGSQNVASARQMETAARNLNDLGQRLKGMVDRYTLEAGTGR